VALGLRKDAKVKLVSKVPLFSGLSRQELGLVASIADEIDLKKGKVLIREGERGREFFVLLEGEADVAKDGRVINQLSAGDFFGEIALVSEGPRTATVRTTSPCALLVLTASAFWGLVSDMPSIERRVLKTLAERLRPLAL
jgi:CRP/FNR family cyclic AMP-dependent transcriptional regulator